VDPSGFWGTTCKESGLVAAVAGLLPTAQALAGQGLSPTSPYLD